MLILTGLVGKFKGPLCSPLNWAFQKEEERKGCW